MSIAHMLLGEFDREVATTRKFLERLPADKLNWKPHEASMTAGQLALHIAQIPKGVLGLSLTDEATPPNVGKGFEQPGSVKAVLDALDESAAYVRTTLPSLDDQRMMRSFKMSMGDRTLLEAPRAGFLRTVMFNHWYHHRGQFGVYLRLLGAKVPSSYGPSGDESPF